MVANMEVANARVVYPYVQTGWQTHWQFGPPEDGYGRSPQSTWVKMASLGGTVEMAFDELAGDKPNWDTGDLSECNSLADACYAGMQVVLQAIDAQSEVTIEYDYLHGLGPAITVQLFDDCYIAAPIAALVAHCRDAPTEPDERAALLEQLAELTEAIRNAPEP